MDAREAFLRGEPGEVTPIRFHVRAEPMPQTACFFFAEELTVDAHQQAQTGGT